MKLMSLFVRLHSASASVRRVQLPKNGAKRLLVVMLIISLTCPSPTFAGVFGNDNPWSFMTLLAQIKSALTKNELVSHDPLERPEPEIKPNPQRESKTALEGKVAKLKTELPNKLELYSRQRMSLPIIPADSKGNPIHGLKAEAESSDKKVAMVTKDGFIIAGNPGRTDITVRVGNQTLMFSVTVVPAPKIKKPEEKQKISSRRLGGARGMNAAWNPNERLTAQFASTSFAATKAKSAAAVQYGGPPPSYQTTRIYDTGRPALRTENGASTPAAATGGTERPGSANFTFAVPLVNLAGRGPSVNLGPFYNGLVWKKSGTDYYFDNESWLAPGFRLGYGKMSVIESNYPPYSSILWPLDSIDADGTHRQYEQKASGIFEATDGTFTQFIDPTPYSYHSVSYIGTVVTANGSRVDYGAGEQTYSVPVGSSYYSRGLDAYPIKITDRNGNYIKINYVSGVGPKIASIQDSLGRYVTFNYAAGELISITAPGYANGDDLQVARFYYLMLRSEKS